MGHMLEGNFIMDTRASSYTNRCQNSRHFTENYSTVMATFPFRTWTVLWSKHFGFEGKQITWNLPRPLEWNGKKFLGFIWEK